MQTTIDTHEASINRAFSKQSANYDANDEANPILRDMRRQVYSHVERFLKPNSRILELNAGTGIDAVHFVSLGHRVHAIDISEGMIEQIKKKQEHLRLLDSLSWQRLSYSRLDLIHDKKFDCVFSNFGGLNCIQDLTVVSKALPPLLEYGAKVTLVIMPPVCLWELLWLLQGKKSALRRFHRNGMMAHLDGEHFRTWYHSLTDIKKAFGADFRFIRSEGLAALSPQPHNYLFPGKHPALYRSLRKLDSLVRDHFPFNRWGDHIIVTFRFEKQRPRRNISGG